MRVAGRPVGDPVSRTEGGLEGDCREAATGRRGPTAPGGHTVRRHSTDAKPPMETALRRDAGAEPGEGPDPGFGNCSGGSLRYALHAPAPADANPPRKPALRRDAGAESGEAPDPGFGNCSGGSLRYALNARPSASQGFASGAARTIGREPAKGDISNELRQGTF